MAGKEKNQVNVTVNLTLDLTPLTLDVYAERTDQTVSAVRAQHHKQTIPTFQIAKGSTVYVNIAQMVLASLEAAQWDVKLPKDIYETVKGEAGRHAA